MYLVTPGNDTLHSNRVGNLIPGVEYLVPEQVMREIKEEWRSTGYEFIGTSEPFERVNWRAKENLRWYEEPRTLLIWNTGQLGDQLYMTALVRALKTLMPSCQIDVVAYANAEEFWKHNKDVRALRYPFVQKALLDCYDAYFIIDEEIVNLTGRDQANCYVELFRLAGLEYKGEQPTITLSVIDELKAFTKITGVKTGEKAYMPASYVVLGLHASRATRNVSKEQWLAIATEIAKSGEGVEGFTIYSLANNEIGHEIQKELNALSCHVPLFASLGLREIAALLRSALCVVSVDSLFTHLSAAVQAPCVALMSTVPPMARTTTYPLCQALWGAFACPWAGCSWKGDTFQVRLGEDALTAPCYVSSKMHCDVALAIKPEHVVGAMQKAMQLKDQFDGYQPSPLKYL